MRYSVSLPQLADILFLNYLASHPINHTQHVRTRIRYVRHVHDENHEMASSITALTPRRSPRLAARSSANGSSKIVTPVRCMLRSFLLAKESSCSIATSGNRTASEMLTLQKLKLFVEESKVHSSLTCETVTADIGNNKVKSFLIITRKLKRYDDDIGPYDDMRLVVTEDGSYKLLASDNLLEENVVNTPFNESCIIPLLNQLSDHSLVVCPGIKGYSEYKDSIGYDLKRVVVNRCPPDSVRDQGCTVLHQQHSTSHSVVCGKCVSLKWQLARRKREHEDLTPSKRAKRQSYDSKVPFELLSPISQKTRINSMRKAIKNLQCKTEYYSEKIERLLANEEQNKEIGELVNGELVNGELVNAIVCSENGISKLKEIYTEANCLHNGLGNQLQDIWSKDFSDWQQFQADKHVCCSIIIIDFN